MPDNRPIHAKPTRAVLSPLQFLPQSPIEAEANPRAFSRGNHVSLFFGALCTAFLIQACTGAPDAAPHTIAPAETVAPPVDEHHAEPWLAELVGSPETAVRALVDAERRASHTGDLALLARLWVPESRVMDRRESVQSNLGRRATIRQIEGETANVHFYLWDGRAAVFNRYVVAVFPHAPPLLTEQELDELQPADTAQNDVYSEGDVVAFTRGTDRWEIVWREGRWWLLTLSYTS